MENVQARLGDWAARFYGEPAQQLRLFGVTGTNGKTSVSLLLAQLLQRLGLVCGCVGTLGYGVPPRLQHSGYTTPGAIQLQSMLAALVDAGARSASLEVSSHGLVQHRLAACRFDTAVFTNLSRDHLDFHGDMKSYGEAKARLFSWPGLRTAVINFDDTFGRELLGSLGPGVRPLAYSLTNSEADIYCTDPAYGSNGISATIHTPWGTGALRSSLLGEFNLANLLAVVAVAGAQGFELDNILAELAGLEGIPGRMEVLESRGPLVILDYAHTPDALAKVLQACREHTAGKLRVVFGCGGNRDTGKRAEMGAVASAADALVITSDNPRDEDPEAIIKQILAGVTRAGSVTVQLDRALAIEDALAAAGAEDCVLIAGKGHEDYQEVAGRKLPFSDAVQVASFLQRGMQQ